MDKEDLHLLCFVLINMERDMNAMKNEFLKYSYGEQKEDEIFKNAYHFSLKNLNEIENYKMYLKQYHDIEDFNKFLGISK